MRRIWNWAVRNWRYTIPAAIAAIALGAWLVFGFFGFHLVFVEEEVDEPPPTFAAGPAPSGIAGDEMTPEMAEAMTDAMAEAEMPASDEVSEDMPAMDTGPVVERIGDFIDRSHPTSGIAEVITGGEQRFLRFEDFSTDNGPDLNVYLSTAAPDAPVDELNEDFVDLGDLKGNIGSQNYEIPPDVDLDRYRTVVIWCVRFSVAFGAAELIPA